MLSWLRGTSEVEDEEEELQGTPSEEPALPPRGIIYYGSICSSEISSLVRTEDPPEEPPVEASAAMAAAARREIHRPVATCEAAVMPFAAHDELTKLHTERDELEAALMRLVESSSARFSELEGALVTEAMAAEQARSELCRALAEKDAELKALEVQLKWARVEADAVTENLVTATNDNKALRALAAELEYELEKARSAVLEEHVRARYAQEKLEQQQRIHDTKLKALEERLKGVAAQGADVAHPAVEFEPMGGDRELAESGSVNVVGAEEDEEDLEEKCRGLEIDVATLRSRLLEKNGELLLARDALVEKEDEALNVRRRFEEQLSKQDARVRYLEEKLRYARSNDGDHWEEREEDAANRLAQENEVVNVGQ